MEYSSIQYVSKPVSRLFYGTTSIPGVEDPFALLDCAYENGINAFDTARVYSAGRSEAILGDWIRTRGYEDKVTVLSKCGHFDLETRVGRANRDGILEDIDLTLQSMKMDHIDLYLLHRDDESVPVSEFVETFNEIKKAGKIDAFGGSNWTHARLQEANDYALAHGLQPFTASSPNYGVGEQAFDLWGGGCVTIAGPAEKEARTWYLEHQMPAIAYSSLACGMFSGKIKSTDAAIVRNFMSEGAAKAYGTERNFRKLAACEMLAEKYHTTVPVIALSWMLHQDLNVFGLFSTRDPERIRENASAADLVLAPEDAALLSADD